MAMGVDGMGLDGTVVAVTGTSGFVGGSVVKRLLDAGAAVRGLVRDREGASRVFRGIDSSRLEFVVGSVGDPASLAQLVGGANAAINLAGLIREGAGGQTFEKVHVEGTANMLRACSEAGVTRYIQMSAMGVKDQGVSEYQRTKWQGEQLVRRSGLAWTIFRPALIHGPRGEFTAQVAKWARGQDPLTPFMPYFLRATEEKSVPLGPTRYDVPVIAPVYVEDVARCMVAALESEEAIGEVIHLCGPETITWSDMYRSYRSMVPHAEEKRPIVGIPGDIAAIGAKLCGMIGLGGVLPFDEGMARMSQEDASCSGAKAEQLLGVSLRAFSASFARYAGSL